MSSLLASASQKLEFLQQPNDFVRKSCSTDVYVQLCEDICVDHKHLLTFDPQYSRTLEPISSYAMDEYFENSKTEYDEELGPSIKRGSKKHVVPCLVFQSSSPSI